MTDSQSKLVEQIVEVVSRNAPDGWTWAHLEVSLLVDTFSGTVVVSKGDRRFIGPVQEGKALSLLRQLRHRMYEPGKGTWYSMTLDIDPDGPTTTTFNTDDEPVFDTPPEAASYVRDLQRYKRRDSLRPQWLQDRVAVTRPAGGSAADAVGHWFKGGV